MKLALLPYRPRVTAGFAAGCNGFMLMAVRKIKCTSLRFVHCFDTETHTKVPPCLCVFCTRSGRVAVLPLGILLLCFLGIWIGVVRAEQCFHVPHLWCVILPGSVVRKITWEWWAGLLHPLQVVRLNHITKPRAF